jgi:hypothetical protein
MVEDSPYMFATKFDIAMLPPNILADKIGAAILAPMLP